MNSVAVHRKEGFGKLVSPAGRDDLAKRGGGLCSSSHRRSISGRRHRIRGCGERQTSPGSGPEACGRLEHGGDSEDSRSQSHRRGMESGGMVEPRGCPRPSSAPCGATNPAAQNSPFPALTIHRGNRRAVCGRIVRLSPLSSQGERRMIIPPEVAAVRSSLAVRTRRIWA